MNLQLFAEREETEEVEEVEVEETQETKEEETQATDKKEFDIKAILDNPEFVKYMESHADKRVSTALSKKEKEYQKQLEAQEKKANMTAEELQQEKEKELAERENQLKQYELKLSKLDYFKEKNYDISLLDFVNGNDEEEIQTNSDKLIDVVNKAVEKVVAERLKGNSYEPPKSKTEGKFDVADLNGMSAEEINKMWEKLSK